MIKPKYSFGKKNFEIKEEFIDREEAKQMYRDKLENNKKEYNVLVFYGVGGIGKSKLRREICRMHKEENTESVTIYLDLNTPDDRNLGTGILKLVDSCDAKIDFKCFEMAYALYFRKKNPSALYGREKGTLKDNPFIDIGLNILSIFDSGITSTATEIVERTARAISNRTIDKNVKEDLKHFDDYSVAEMEERLPLFFQYDLKSYLDKYPKAKTLIVFDTFEALNENVIDQIHRNKNERWVQDIISYLDAKNFPSLLVTIFGRDKIEWNEEWIQFLDQYQLTEFTNEFSEKYLLRAGITNPEITTAIIKSSNGYPFMLYLSLETYANMKNNSHEPTAKDFIGSYPEIIERFLYNLDKDTVEVLRLMSIPNYYDADIFAMLIKEFNISFPMTEFEQFNKYSFVSYDNREKEYFIHDLMRKGILEKSSEDLIKIAHKRILLYYYEKIEHNIKIKNIIQMFYHARKSKNVDEFNEWLKNPIADSFNITPLQVMKRQQEYGEQSILIQIIDGIQSDYSLDLLLIDLVNIYIDIVHLGGNYDRAVSICNQYLSKYTFQEIVNDEQLIKMRIRKIHHSMFYMPVDRLICEAEKLISSAKIKCYPNQYNELLFLLGGNLGVLSGNFDYCERWLNESLAYAQEHQLGSFAYRTLRKQADIRLCKDDIQGAWNMINGIVSINMESTDIDSRYKIYLMGTLGEIYRKQGCISEAMHCFEVIYNKSKENNLPGWMAHANFGKGMVEFQQNHFEIAEQYFDEAYRIYNRINQIWGKINVSAAMLLLKKKQGVKLAKEEVQSYKAAAGEMNYRYNVRLADKLIEMEDPYLQLFFL